MFILATIFLLEVIHDIEGDLKAVEMNHPLLNMKVSVESYLTFFCTFCIMVNFFLPFSVLMSSRKVVNDQHLDCVADNIGENWKALGIYLQMKKAAIYRFEQDYKDDHREVR